MVKKVSPDAVYAAQLSEQLEIQNKEIQVAYNAKIATSKQKHHDGLESDLKK